MERSPKQAVKISIPEDDPLSTSALGFSPYHFFSPPVTLDWLKYAPPESHLPFRKVVLEFIGLRGPDGHVCESLHPESPFINAWSFAQALFLLYVAVVVPFRIGFESELMCNPDIVRFDLFLDIFFICDIILQFFTGYRKFEQFEFNRRRVVVHYLKSYFVFDVIISIPVTWMTQPPSMACAGGNSGYAATKLLRLLRLVRVVRVIKLFNLPMFAGARVNHFVLQLVKIALACLFCMHWCACSFWLVKSFEQDDLKLLWEAEQRIDHSPVFDKYVAALYFAGATITTVGYGDIAAENTSERVYALFVMLLGAGIFAGLISNLSSLVSSGSGKEKQYQAKCRDLEEFFEYHHVPEAIAKRVKDFYFYNYQVSESQSSLALAMELPTVLRTDLCKHLATGVLGPVDLFSGAPPEYITMVFLSLTPFRCTAGETVIEAGQPGTCMYIIYKGKVKIVSASRASTGSVTLGPGSVFGEVSCLTDDLAYKRTTTVVALEYCELYVLERDVLQLANSLCPEMQRRFEVLATSRVTDLDILNKQVLQQKEKSGKQVPVTPRSSGWIPFKRTQSASPGIDSAMAPATSVPPVSGTLTDEQRGAMGDVSARLIHSLHTPTSHTGMPGSFFSGASPGPNLGVAVNLQCAPSPQASTPVAVKNAFMANRGAMTPLASVTPNDATWNSFVFHPPALNAVRPVRTPPGGGAPGGGGPVRTPPGGGGPVRTPPGGGGPVRTPPGGPGGSVKSPHEMFSHVRSPPGVAGNQRLPGLRTPPGVSGQRLAPSSRSPPHPPTPSGMPPLPPLRGPPAYDAQAAFGGSPGASSGPDSGAGSLTAGAFGVIGRLGSGGTSPQLSPVLFHSIPQISRAGGAVVSGEAHAVELLAAAHITPLPATADLTSVCAWLQQGVEDLNLRELVDRAQQFQLATKGNRVAAMDASVERVLNSVSALMQLSATSGRHSASASDGTFSEVEVIDEPAQVSVSSPTVQLTAQPPPVVAPQTKGISVAFAIDSSERALFRISPSHLASQVSDGPEVVLPGGEAHELGSVTVSEPISVELPRISSSPSHLK